MRLAIDGVVRVGGGVPIFSRAAALTAEAALNGLGLRSFDGNGLPPETNHGHFNNGKSREKTIWIRHEPQIRIPAGPRRRHWLARRPWDELGGGWISVRVTVRLGYSTDLDGGVHVVAPGYNRLLIQCEQFGVLHRTFQDSNRGVSG